MIENESKSFTNISTFFEIMVVEHGVCDHDLRKVIKILVKTFLFFIIEFDMMKFLAIIQVKAVKTMIKESNRGLT